MIATCNWCKEFKVPWDEIGAAIMKGHLRECLTRKPPEEKDRPPVLDRTGRETP